MALFEIENLSFKYPLSNDNALNKISLSVKAGDFCLFLGKSGSGKSTLLRLLKKEIAPNGELSGNLKINANEISFVGQNVESNIVTDTVYGELAFTLENQGKSSGEIGLKIAEVASYFDLNGIFGEKTENLSGGSKQMLSLAASVTVNPSVLVLDEPVSQLDPTAAENFINTVVKLNREQGITVLISEHKCEKLLPFANKIIYLESGNARLFESPSEFAAYLIENNDEFQSVLPAYTRAFKDMPVDFISAKSEVGKLEYTDNQLAPKFDDIALKVKNLAFAYGKGLPDVIFDLNYNAYRGKINCIVGSNGCGKTTLLKALAGIVKCCSGKVKSKGKVCYMPQNVKTMFLKDTVAEELENNAEIIKYFELENLAGRNPFDLSGGEEQRLALAKIVLTGADVILLDEPTKSVDCVFKNKFSAMLKDLCSRGKTVVLVTHDLEFAADCADYVSFLFDKNIISGAPAFEFFSNLSIYTTALARLTNGKAVSLADLKGSNE